MAAFKYKKIPQFIGELKFFKINRISNHLLTKVLNAKGEIPLPKEDGSTIIYHVPESTLSTMKAIALRRGLIQNG